MTSELPKKTKLVNISSYFLFIALTSLAVFLFLQYKNLEKTPSSKLSVATENNNVDGWEVYANEKFGFAFESPFRIDSSSMREKGRQKKGSASSRSTPHLPYAKAVLAWPTTAANPLGSRTANSAKIFLSKSHRTRFNPWISLL